MPPPRPAPPTLPIGDAIAASERLSALVARVRESMAHLDTVRALLPADLSARVRAGPLDDDGWTLLVDGPAAAAKLRQMRPSLEAALAGPKLRIRVAPRR
jgi:hypothetical protein